MVHALGPVSRSCLWQALQCAPLAMSPTVGRSRSQLEASRSTIGHTDLQGQSSHRHVLHTSFLTNQASLSSLAILLLAKTVDRHLQIVLHRRCGRNLLVHVGSTSAPGFVPR